MCPVGSAHDFKKSCFFWGGVSTGFKKRMEKAFAFADGNVCGVGAGVKARNLINRRLLLWVDDGTVSGIHGRGLTEGKMWNKCPSVSTVVFRNHATRYRRRQYHIIPNIMQFEFSIANENKPLEDTASKT